jgi:hypothetical protein
MKRARTNRTRNTAGPSAHAGAEVIGKPLPKEVNRAVLRAMVAGDRYFKLDAAATKDGKTRMQLSTLISVPVDVLKHWLEHDGEDPESVLSEEDANSKLRRYEFMELENEADELAKTFGAEIVAAHPMNAEDSTATFTRHGLAMQLVGERHAKCELVELVNWLLTFKDKVEAAPDHTAVLETLAQYRNDLHGRYHLTEGEVERRLAALESAAALLPGGTEFMQPTTSLCPQSPT